VDDDDGYALLMPLAFKRRNWKCLFNVLAMAHKRLNIFVAMESTGSLSFSISLSGSVGFEDAPHQRF
jgi:hypothetical protein